MLSPVACQKLGVSEYSGRLLLDALHREIIRLEFANQHERAAAFKVVAEWMEK